MQVLFFLTILGFSLGQLAAIPLGNNVTLYMQDIFLVCLFLYAIVTKQLKIRGSLLVPISVFIGVSFFSLIINVYRFSLGELWISSLYLWRWILYASLYFLAMQSAAVSRRLVTWLYWSGVFVALLGLIQYIYYPYLRNLSYLGWDPHLYRVFSTFFDPNYLSLYLVLTLFLGIYLYTGKLKIGILIGQLLSFAALLLTYSRSGYVALFIGLLVYAVCMRKLKILVIGFMLFAALLFVLPKSDGEGVNLLRTASTFARVGNWQRGFLLIKESPVFGFGFNTLRFVQERKNFIDTKSTVPSKAGAGLDDSFQFVWVTTGIIGLLSYLWIVFCIGKLFVRLLNNRASRVLGVVGLSGLLATIVHSQFINSLFYPQILMWWWIMSGFTEKQVLTADTSRVVQPSSGSLRGRSRRRSTGSHHR